MYAESKDTDIWCLAWAFDDEEPEIWVPLTCVEYPHLDEESNLIGVERHWEVTPLPTRVLAHIAAGGEIRAWNAQFERIIWREIMVKRYGAPEVKMEQWVCSAAEAAAMALPRHLGGAAHVLKVKQEKDDEGYRLMLRMARPRKITPEGPIWWDVEERKQRLFDYCKQDVRTERALVGALRRLTPKERNVYLLDQRVNDRGIHVDLDLVAAATNIVDQGVTRANARLDDLTGGDVGKITHNRKLVEWLNDNDIETESISKAAVAALLEQDDLASNVKEVLELRAQAGRSSVAKLKTLVDGACVDGAARGLLLYHGASTGRWTGKLIQPQNFPRGEVEDVESYIDWILAGEYELLDLIAPPIIIVLSLLRGMLTARPGHELIAGDYSAIEARVLNWLAGQDDVVKMFAAGIDVYKHNGARLYGIPIEQVQKMPHRHTGKFSELACGFGMGKKKAVSAAKAVYGLDLSPELAAEIVDDYRASHPHVVSYWYALENAAIGAVTSPGEVFTVRGTKFVVRGGYLYVVLPSGRPLCYAAPSVKDKMTPWGEMKAAVHFWGVNPKTRQWDEQSAYGGLWAENITQAVARDLMAEGMLRLEAAGYPPILSVHDEAVSEVPQGFGSVEEFEALMSETPAWATGCPVAAEGWRGVRYRK